MSGKSIHIANPWNHPLFKESAFNKVELDQMKQEIGETKENRYECVENLTKKLKEQKNFAPYLDEVFLLGYLRISKFNTSKACDRILKFYRQHKNLSHDFKKVGESAVSKTEYFRHASIGPCRMKDNSILLFNKHCLMEPDKMSFEENFFLDCIMCNEITSYPAIQFGGITAIMDFSGLTFQKLLMHTPKRVAAYVNAFQNTFPLSYKAIHLININKFFHLLYKIIYPLLNDKMRSRIVLHSYDPKYKSLHSYVPPELLPKEYCGHIEQSEMVDILSSAKEMSQEYQKHSKFGFVNKKLR